MNGYAWLPNSQGLTRLGEAAYCANCVKASKLLKIYSTSFCLFGHNRDCFLIKKPPFQELIDSIENPYWNHHLQCETLIANIEQLHYLYLINFFKK